MELRNQTAMELRKAAASARAFADSISLPELKRSFRDMARRWEAEADQREEEEKLRRSGTSEDAQAFAQGRAWKTH